MIITAANLDQLFTGYKASYQRGFAGAAPQYLKVATIVNSTTSEEMYPFLAALPGMREWIGERIVHNLVAHGYSIKNKDFEETRSVPANKIKDDQYGVFAPLMEEMGRAAAIYPDEITMSLLPAGFAATCYDGQAFFSTTHVAGYAGHEDYTASNMTDGAGQAWYLLDCSRPIRPLVFQEREKPNFVSITDPRSENVFWKNEYVYGSSARGNSGYGLWQLAHASKAEMDADSFEAALLAMTTLKSEHGKPLGIRPTVLAVPNALEGAARRLLSSDRVIKVDVGGTITPVSIKNEWAGAVELVISPWL